MTYGEQAPDVSTPGPHFGGVRGHDSLAILILSEIAQPHWKHLSWLAS